MSDILFFEVKSDNIDFNNLSPTLYQPKYFEIIEKTSHYPKLESLLSKDMTMGSSLKDQSKPSKYGYVKVHNVLPYVMGFSDITHVVNTDNVDPTKILEEGDVLISRVGTAGRISLYETNSQSHVFSENVLRVKINKDEVYPRYLVAFLNSHFGKLQMERIIKGAIQDVINQSTVGKIRIILPTAKQGGMALQIKLGDTIFNTLKKSQIGELDAESIYQNVDDFVMNELNLSPPPIKKETTFEVSPTEFTVKRFDPIFYHPDHIRLKKYLKKQNSKRLVEKCDFPDRPITKSDFETNGTLYVEINGVDKRNGKIIKTKKLTKQYFPSRAKQQIFSNDILFSMTRPTKNAIIIVPEHLDGQICTSGFAILDNPNVDNDYLFTILRTNIVKNQVSHRTRSSLYPAILLEDLKEILIPPLSENKKKIGITVKNMLKKAERLMENSIKNNEEVKSEFEKQIDALT